MQHSHRIVDDVRVAGLGAVQQPFRDLELGVEHRALPNLPVGAAPGLVVGVETALRDQFAARTEQPEQVACRVADTEGMPADDRGHGVFLKQERCGSQRTVDDGGLELPEFRFLGGVLPTRQESAGNQPGRCRPVEEGDTRLEAVVGCEQRQSGIRNKTGGKRVNRGDRAGHRGRMVGVEVAEGGRGTVKVLEDHGANALIGGLTGEGGCGEGKPRANAGAERIEGGELGGLLRHCTLVPRRPSE